MSNSNAYNQLEREALRHGLPVAFTDDLTVYDWELLHSDDAPETFGWILREHGTDLFEPCTGASNWPRAIVESDPDVKCYWYDGETLNSVEPEQLFNLLEGNDDNA